MRKLLLVILILTYSNSLLSQEAKGKVSEKELAFFANTYISALKAKDSEKLTPILFKKEEIIDFFATNIKERKLSSQWTEMISDDWSEILEEIRTEFLKAYKTDLNNRKTDWGSAKILHLKTEEVASFITDEIKYQLVIIVYKDAKNYGILMVNSCFRYKGKIKIYKGEVNNISMTKDQYKNLLTRMNNE
ncbi:MAG: hypothetical protein JXR05_09225 [Flavobacteriaceae bacterium]